MPKFVCHYAPMGTYHVESTDPTIQAKVYQIFGQFSNFNL